ncbi:MAG: hypothetical protein M1831_006534 [Alyxoria varia]|nr:MAG: hypothetical protein M1831_006534 [Alyxoria varia]
MTGALRPTSKHTESRVLGLLTCLRGGSKFITRVFPVHHIITTNDEASATFHHPARILQSFAEGSNRVSKFRNLTAQVFARSAELQRRARLFLRRELQVFDFLSPDGIEESRILSTSSENRLSSNRRRSANAEFLLEYVVSLLKTVEIRDSDGKAEVMVAEFLGASNASLFLHELNAWLRSPYERLEDWDSHVQYQQDIPNFSDPTKPYDRTPG